jgi:hypothetical protein
MSRAKASQSPSPCRPLIALHSHYVHQDSDFVPVSLAYRSNILYLKLAADIFCEFMSASNQR